MQQVQFNAYGTPEVLQLLEVDMPQPQTGELLIRIEAAGVNYSDVLRRKNTYFMPTPLPFVLGAEAVGNVVDIGGGTETHLKIGDRVLAMLPYGGGYAEYVAVAAQYCIPLPPHVDSDAATAIFVQGSTAHLILDEKAGDVRGKSVLVHAAAGGVGSLLVQLAKLVGAKKVIAAASSDEKLATARHLGADAAVNYSNSGWAKEVIAANDGNKVDLILEMVGGDIYAQCFECLAAGGKVVVYGAAGGQKGFVHSEHFVDESQSVEGFNLAFFIQHKMQKWQESLGAVIGLVAEGKLKVNVKDIFPLREVALAHTLLEGRLTTGKVVLKP